MQKKFYITTTLPYVNADPHIGFGLEIVQADVIARYHRMCGDEVIFNTGTDEHGQKIWKAATDAKMDTQAYCDLYAAKFAELKAALNLSYTHFIRTTDAHHVKAAQAFWLRCREAGDIYKKQYQVKYCVGCELEKTDSELGDDRCPLHPKLAIEFRDEENYFFRWSKYQQPLLDYYAAHPDFVLPEGRYQEIKNFVSSGLQDFSISRLKTKMPWGIAVPDDPAHVMYVWFDALINYIATLGWPEDEGTFKTFWPGVQIAGKDNLRQQSAMWQGMLLSAGLPLSQQILIHGFFTVDGQKISKSLGNVINPIELTQKYSIDAVRYFFLREIPFGEDGDFSIARLGERYNSDLANGVGNLTARVVTLAAKVTEGHPESFDFAQDKLRRGISHSLLEEKSKATWGIYEKAINEFRFHDALAAVWDFIKTCDGYIEEKKPWALKGEEAAAVIAPLLESLRAIAWWLWPVMPTTAEGIFTQLGILEEAKKQSLDTAKKWGGTVFHSVKGNSLFPRLTS
ncbi:MAG: class I tRNA ligase family protein [bacterium]|nr:class I tRNA ligase family protein [bacterium]